MYLWWLLLKQEIKEPREINIVSLHYILHVLRITDQFE